MAASTTNTLVCFCFILFCRFGRIRGSGTFLAITMFNTSTRDKVIYEMRQRGVELGGCGAFSIRLRPSMVFTPDHAAEFLRIFDEVSERSEPRAKRAASEASRERSELGTTSVRVQTRIRATANPFAPYSLGAGSGYCASRRGLRKLGRRLGRGRASKFDRPEDRRTRRVPCG